MCIRDRYSLLLILCVQQDPTRLELKWQSSNSTDERFDSSIRAQLWHWPQEDASGLVDNEICIANVGASRLYTWLLPQMSVIVSLKHHSIMSTLSKPMSLDSYSANQHTHTMMSIACLDFSSWTKRLLLMIFSDPMSLYRQDERSSKGTPIYTIYRWSQFMVM